MLLGFVGGVVHEAFVEVVGIVGVGVVVFVVVFVVVVVVVVVAVVVVVVVFVFVFGGVFVVEVVSVGRVEKDRNMGGQNGHKKSKESLHHTSSWLIYKTHKPFSSS